MAPIEVALVFAEALFQVLNALVWTFAKSDFLRQEMFEQGGDGANRAAANVTVSYVVCQVAETYT